VPWAEKGELRSIIVREEDKMSMEPLIVTATFDWESSTLTLAPQQPLELRSGESVRWNFEGVPPGFLPFISFPSTGPFGPFQAFELLGSAVLGIGHSGHSGENSYTALVLDPSLGQAVASADGTIQNLSANEPLVAVVRFDPEPPSLEILPVALKLDIGQSAIWYLAGLSPKYFVTFRFDGFPDPMVGPFLSFSLSGGFGSLVQAVGVDFLSAAASLVLPGPFSYSVSVWDAQDKQVVVRHDPVIDRLGSPPTSPMD
jgi:hypothetical protein